MRNKFLALSAYVLLASSCGTTESYKDDNGNNTIVFQGIAWENPSNVIKLDTDILTVKGDITAKYGLKEIKTRVFHFDEAGKKWVEDGTALPLVVAAGAPAPAPAVKSFELTMPILGVKNGLNLTTTTDKITVKKATTVALIKGSYRLEIEAVDDKGTKKMISLAFHVE